MPRLTEKAVLVALNISRWTGQKLDKEVTAEACDSKGATSDAGRFNKQLLPKEAFEPITKLVNEARSFHYSNTLPWLHNGTDLLPSANYLKYMTQMRNYRAKFESLVDTFLDDYDSNVAKAAIKLNGMFRQEDYPKREALKRRFGFDTNVFPVPDSNDFRVKISDEEMEIVQAEAEERINEATAFAMRALWGRLHEAISHCVNKLSDKDAIFRNSLIDNVQELCDLLPALNVADDPNLTKMADEIRAKICTASPDELRTDKVFRADVAKQADAILSAMSGYLGA